MKKKLTEKDLNIGLLERLAQLKAKMEEDQLIYGDAFIHLTDRKIEVLKPTDVTLELDKKGLLKNINVKEHADKMNKVIYGVKR